MNNQEVFNFVAKALIKQGASSRNNDRCLYLDDKGNKCAVGHLLSENELKIYGNFTGGVNSLSRYAKERVDIVLCSKIDNLNKWFLFELQQVHDSIEWNLDEKEWVKAFKFRMRKFAKNFDLDDGVLDDGS